MWQRLIEHETLRNKREGEQAYLEARRQELRTTFEPVGPKLMNGPDAPTDEERKLRETTHLPAKAWRE